MFWNQKITVTSTQESLIPVLREQWQKVAFSNKPIDLKTVTDIVNKLYQYLGLKPPQIVYCSSPFQAIKYLLTALTQDLDTSVINDLQAKLLTVKDSAVEVEMIDILVQKLINDGHGIQEKCGQTIKGQVEKLYLNQLDENKFKKLDVSQVSQWDSQLRNTAINQEINTLNAQHLNSINHQVLGLLLSNFVELIDNREFKALIIKLANLLENKSSSQFVTRLENRVAQKLLWANCIYPEMYAIAQSRLQFYGDTLKLAKDPMINQIFNHLLANCGWFFPFTNLCLVCDRPFHLSLDQQHRLHQENGMAMLYNDGYGIYAHHGVIIPKLYGDKPAAQWQAAWILSETNAELRRTLIQGIGYDRLCQELKATELNSWREYTLLYLADIIDPVDQQPIYLLKMTCPSTGFIHALRVPPDMRSAKDAILWVNWGIDPDDIIMAS